MQAATENNSSIPQWYIVVEGNKIIAGAGVIENDLYRCQGIAGKLLDYVCNDMKEMGIETLYLITEHTSFYEKYDWRFLCMVEEENEPNQIRMYVHEESLL